MNFFTFFELSTFLPSLIIYFELVKTIIQMLHIAHINIYQRVPVTFGHYRYFVMFWGPRLWRPAILGPDELSKDLD